MRGLDFNSNASNLLASGAADGETLVWDLTNPQAPNSFKVVGGHAYTFRLKGFRVRRRQGDSGVGPHISAGAQQL